MGLITPNRRDELARMQQAWLVLYRLNCDFEKPEIAVYYDCILKMAIESERELRNRIANRQASARPLKHYIEPADVPRAIVYGRGHNHAKLARMRDVSRFVPSLLNPVRSPPSRRAPFPSKCSSRTFPALIGTHVKKRPRPEELRGERRPTFYKPENHRSA